MNRSDARALLGHGAIVLLLGMLFGFFLAPVTIADDTDGIRAWRMAHLEGVLNGLLMIGVAAAAPLMVLSRRWSKALRLTLMITGYGNVLASGLAAQQGVRGLQAGGSLANLAAFLGFVLAVLAVLVALAVVAFGSFRSEGDL